MNEATLHAWDVEPEDAGRRVDVVVAGKLAELSRSQATRLVDDGLVQVGGKVAKPALKVAAGDRIEVHLPPPAPSPLAPKDIPLSIVHEDSDLLVIDKPRGMAVHPAPGTGDDTLVNALLARCTDLSGIGGVERPGIVHRLDKDTTGLLVVAKNDTAHRSLQAQIQARTARRQYEALVWGSPRFEEAVVDAPIGRHPTDRTRMAVIDPAKGGGTARDAVTELRVVERLGPISRLECTLQTGRTHQIRVHCKFAGIPVVGDPVYGGERKSGDTEIDRRVAALGGQALHASRLVFRHPRTGEEMAFESPPPAPIRELAELLRRRKH
ncbi:MAG: RluA family pseudouridine synthase [Armatimonadota bacterium]